MNNDKKIFNQRTTSFLEFDTNVPHNIFIRNVKLLRIGQIVVNFDILLEKSRIIFHGSPDINKIRTVRGKVRLEVAGKLNVKEIILSLVGDYNISLDLINDISSSPSSLSLPENQGTIFSSSILLENKRILPPGVHEFYFEFLLPGNLPESMCSDAILCKYFLKAELVTRFADELSTDKNKLIDVADLFIERTILETDESIKHGLKPTRFIGGNNDLLDFEFILPKIMKLNSSSIEFIGRWDGFNRVDKISFCFVQSECYSIAKDKCIAHSEKSIAGPFQFQLPKREPLKLQSRPMIFKLPICKSFVNDYDLVNVKIRHQLNVKIQLNNFRKDQIEFSIPISIKSTIPDLDTLPLPRRIDLSNSVACLQLGNKIYTSKSSSSSLSSSSSPSSSKRININKQSIFKLPSKIFNDNNGDEIDTNEISTFDDESNFIRPSKSLSNIRKQMFQILSKTTSRNKNPSLFDDTEQKAKVFNNNDNDNDNDISKNITGNGVIINVNNSGISTITESSSEFSVEGDDDVINDVKDVKYNNIRRDCGNDDDDIKANTTITAATTATYTNNTLLQNNNNKFNASEFPKPNFVTSSANIIAENFMKFNYLLQQKHYQNKKNIHNNHIGTTTNNNNNEENNNDDETNRQLQYKDHRHHRPPPTKLPKRNSRTSRASSVSTCVPPDARDYVKNLNHYKYINNHHNSNINDNVIS